jgi:hypothetical protein
MTTCAFIVTNPTDESIASGLPVIHDLHPSRFRRAGPLDDHPRQVLTRRCIPLWETGRAFG